MESYEKLKAQKDAIIAAEQAPVIALQTAARKALAFYDALVRPHDDGEQAVLDELQRALTASPAPAPIASAVADETEARDAVIEAMAKSSYLTSTVCVSSSTYQLAFGFNSYADMDVFRQAVKRYGNLRRLTPDKAEGGE